MELSGQTVVRPISILCPLLFFANMTSSKNQVILKIDLQYDA